MSWNNNEASAMRAQINEKELGRGRGRSQGNFLLELRVLCSSHRSCVQCRCWKEEHKLRLTLTENKYTPAHTRARAKRATQTKFSRFNVAINFTTIAHGPLFAVVHRSCISSLLSFTVHDSLFIDMNTSKN